MSKILVGDNFNKRLNASRNSKLTVKAVYAILQLCGGVSERLKEAVLKTVEPLRVPWVRIPPPPPFIFIKKLLTNLVNSSGKG
jgi:hypothetical protein